MKLIAISLLLLVALSFVYGLSRRSDLSAQVSQPPPQPPQNIPPGPLNEEQFWTLIDHSAAFEADSNAQLTALKTSLGQLTADQIADFEKMFDGTMRRSYSWDLWGAAYVANGGASDDGFEYFRCWLISKGQRVFEAVLADPDSLADLLAPGEDGGDLEFEEFAYAARQAWEAKTGKDWNAMPVVANMAYDHEPSGKPFSEDPDALATRYPKLWKRFGG